MSKSVGWQAKRYDELWRGSVVIYESWAKKRGISYSELLVMDSIFRGNGRCTQKMICQQWAFPKQTVHSILKQFRERGWVCFDPLERDRRNKTIRWTQEGERLAGEIMEDLDSRERRVLERLGEARVQALLENTALYNRYFQEAEDCETV